MRRTCLIGVAVLVLVVLGGCDQTDVPIRRGVASPTVAEDDDAVAVVDVGVLDDRNLSVGFDTCGGLTEGALETRLVETGAEVWVYASVQGPDPYLCQAGLTMELAKPLGDRQVIDGSSGEVVRSGG